MDGSGGSEESAQRTFLVVRFPSGDPSRHFQLEARVRFKNVLKAVRLPGELFWGDRRLLPQETPLSTNMPRGEGNAVGLVFQPLAPRGEGTARDRGKQPAPAAGDGGKKKEEGKRSGAAEALVTSGAPPARCEEELERRYWELRLLIEKGRARRELLESQVEGVRARSREREAWEFHQMQMTELRERRRHYTATEDYTV